MYGLVNKAIEDLIRSRFGDATWQAIRKQAGVQAEEFVRMEDYPDELSYRLVAAASQQLALPPEQLLEAFGEYWTLYTAKEGYGDMLKAYGDSLFAFLQNLDDLHTRVGMFYPKLKPPHFECSDVTAHSLVLHYYSERPGLAPMVIGLVKGLGTTFNTPVAISQVQDRNAGADHDAFLLRIGLE